MSEQSIYDKSVEIRIETKEYANTRGRVADVIDDINSTKSNKTNVDAAIQTVVDELDIFETEIRDYVDSENDAQNLEIDNKLDVPSEFGDFYVTKEIKDGAIYSRYKPISLTDGQIAKSFGNYIGASAIYEDSSGKIGLGKTNPTEKLDVNGRVKYDGVVLNETSGAILPREIKFKAGNFVGAGNDGVEKKFLREGDVNFTGLIQRYVHSGNKVLIPTAIDYATGNVTVPNHGLTINQIYTAGGVPNSFANGSLTGTDWSYLPYEYTNAFVRLKPIDANTVQVLNQSNVAITVNTASTENNGKLDITKWHIELVSIISPTNLPYGIKNIRLKIFYMLSTASTDRIFRLNLYDSNNTIFTNTNVNPDQNIGNNSSIRFYAGNAAGLINTNLEVDFSVYNGINSILFRGTATNRTAGASSFTPTSVGSSNWTSRILTVQNNTGIANIFNDTGLGVIFNGSVIEIYKL